MRYGIVTIGYNRLESMRRLIERLKLCNYGSDEVTLIISLDKWKNSEIVDFANSVEWNHGEKIVKTFSENQGLRKHILKCGSYMEEFDLDAIAVFEDDIVPSVDFYQFMRQAVPVYCNDKRVAGIALYSFQWHPIANKPFIPTQGRGAVYLNKFAVSWGQIWMKQQWKEFVNWLERTSEEDIISVDIPEEVKGWKNSWLKYHIAYCCNMEKYFVYPYRSFSTCYAETGEHTELSLNRFQVPVVQESGTVYEFLSIDDITVRYDSFFESEFLANKLLEDGFDTCVDLYGIKKNKNQKRYWLTGTSEPFKVEKTFGLTLKPHEQNVLNNMYGNSIFLYDTNNNARLANKIYNIEKYIFYFNGNLEKGFILWHLKNKIRNLLKK